MAGGEKSMGEEKALSEQRTAQTPSPGLAASRLRSRPDSEEEEGYTVFSCGEDGRQVLDHSWRNADLDGRLLAKNRI